MTPTVKLGVTLAAASTFGCYAPPAHRTPVQSEGVRLSVLGTYCTPPEDFNVENPLPTRGELGAKVKVENTTDHEVTIDSKGVRALVNGELKEPSIFHKVYQVPPRS